MTRLGFVRRYPWIWPVASSLALFALILIFSPVLRYSIFTANLAAASFLALVGIGQMFPIASGEGGIDLSIPFVMNFCAFLAVQMVDASIVSIPIVLLISIAFGLAVGLANGIVVVAFRIPPIIGTLAVGYVVLTLVQLISSRGGATTFAARGFTNVIRTDILGVPAPFFVVLVVGGLAALLVNRTSFGRSLLAVGQSRQAAYLSGIKVNRTIVVAYLISGGIAALTGVLLAASVGSADLELGNPYLLASVGAVVLGGNRVAGGTATVVGTVAGAVVLTLLVAVVTVAHLPLEFQNIARGAVITLVLVLANVPDVVAGTAKKRSRFSKSASSARDNAQQLGTP
jgi:ribose transport system permease protein